MTTFACVNVIILAVEFTATGASVIGAVVHGNIAAGAATSTAGVTAVVSAGVTAGAGAAGAAAATTSAAVVFGRTMRMVLSRSVSSICHPLLICCYNCGIGMLIQGCRITVNTLLSLSGPCTAAT